MFLKGVFTTVKSAACGPALALNTLVWVSGGAAESVVLKKPAGKSHLKNGEMVFASGLLANAEKCRESVSQDLKGIRM